MRTGGLVIALCLVLTSSRLAQGDGLTPYHRAQEATRLLRDGKASEAAVLFAQAVQENPDNGRIWRQYAVALYHARRYEDSTSAYLRAIELGDGVIECTYNVACNHALSGNKDEALRWLEKALEVGFRDEQLWRTDGDLQLVRDDPRFHALLATAPPEGLSRGEQWRFDLDFLARRAEQLHYNLYRKVSRENFHAMLDALKAGADSTSDSDMAVGVQRLLATVGDGHTRILGHAHHGWPFSTLPIDVYWFSDGLHIRGASPEHRDLVGGKLVRIGNASVEEAVSRVRPVCSVDNEMGVKSWTALALSTPEILYAQGITSDPSSATITVVAPKGNESTITLSAVADGPRIGGWLREGWIYANTEAAEPAPLYLRDLKVAHWFTHLPNRNLVYAAYQAVENRPEQTVAQFAERLFQEVEEKEADYLVIDMRLNGGGNNYLNRPLVHGLIKCERINRSGHLFVITGRRTFSAAMNGAVDIERNTSALFVGEPTGSSPNFVGETSPVTLPFSELRVSISTAYWQSSTATDGRTWIAPALPASLSYADFRDNRDPAMEAILAHIEAERRTAETGGSAESPVAR